MVIPKYRPWYSTFHYRQSCKISYGHDEELKLIVCAITFHDGAMWCQIFDPPLIEKYRENNQSKYEPHKPWQEGCSSVMWYLNETCEFDWS
jgi:hypothetical protein